MRSSAIAILACASGTLMLATPVRPQVVLVEPGHALVQHVDSIVPLHPSQVMLEVPSSPAGLGEIESICVDRQTGDVYFQLIVPPVTPTSVTSDVYRLTPATKVVTPIVLNTGFGIAENGADMHIDYQRQMLVVQDQNWILPTGMPNPRLAFVTMFPPFGTGTWCLTGPAIVNPGTFGMDFSNGAGGSVIPAGDIVFTGDASWDGVHQATFAAPGGTIMHVPPPVWPLIPGPADDLVMQPDGDWIWFGDVNRPICQIKPFAPFPVVGSALTVSTIFAANPVPSPFTHGTRAAVCDITGEMYVTCTGATGGSALFRIDEPLKNATLILTVGGPNANQGIHDVEVGPSTFSPNWTSVYFTVHDQVTGAEQIWEVSATACCPTPASAVPVADAFGWNVPNSIAAFPAGNLPKLGNATFAVQLDDPGMGCLLTPGGTITVLVISGTPAATPSAAFGCFPPGGAGVLQVGPFLTIVPAVMWPGPGVGAVHALPIPFLSALCGAPVFAQGLFIDPLRGALGSPFALSWQLNITLGS